MMRSDDTIFALSSGRGPAAIAVVRISGPRAGEALEALAGRLPQPRHATLARLRHPQSGDTIDQALVLWFPGPASETGEDVAELQLHGGHAVIAAVLAALGSLAGLRPAEAGEFTRRAFANGRLDLTQVEGLADLIAAETEAQRRQAVRQLQGALGARAEAWRRRLIEAQARVEAGLDFSDEGDVPADLLAEAVAVARALADEIAAALAEARRGERVRDGFVVAIAGPPNAGKSTLLNRIARRDVAIVSPYAGTTRDVIEVHLDLDGYPVTLLDTAGIRDSADPVEQEGVRRALARAAAADLVLWVVDASAQAALGSGAAGAGAAGLGGQPGSAQAWRIVNKIDLVGGSASLAGGPDAWPEGEPSPGRAAADTGDRTAGPGRPSPASPPTARPFKDMNNNISSNNIFLISATTGAGLDTLLEALAREAAAAMAGGAALVTRARQQQALQETEQALRRAVTAGAEDLVAEELRLAARALGRLTGRVDVEDILDVIFRDFCIGK